MDNYKDLIMKKFNLRKRASADSAVISDKAIQENREKMGHSVSQQGVAEKNINLSLPIKDKDNTVPFNVQLNTARKNAEAEPSITESDMDDKDVSRGSITCNPLSNSGIRPSISIIPNRLASS